MPTTSKLQRIVHPTDLAQDSEFAFYHALRLAVAAKSKLDVLHVGKDTVTMAWKDYPSISRTLAQWELVLEGHEPDADGDQTQTITAYGREPVRPILDYLDESLPDLLVLATHRRHGLDRWMHKEIAQKLARRRAMPTLFVPFGEEGFVSPTRGSVELHRVVLPIDWLPGPQAAIDAAADLVQTLECENVRWTLVHVKGSDEDFPAVSVPTRPGWTWDRQRRSGDVVDEILVAAKEAEADLVVMVTAGHDGFLDALRGSTTERVLQRAPCPLLAVPTLDTPG